MKIQGIYKIINCINGKIYIGQSIDTKNRFRQHKYNALTKNIKHPLYASIRKYGIENFEFIIVERIEDVNNMNEKELYWINYYKSNDLNYGYNLRLDCATNRGCTFSEEVRKRFSERQKILWKDLEYRNNFSKKQKGRMVWNKGKKMSDESNKQNSERLKNFGKILYRKIKC